MAENDKIEAELLAHLEGVYGVDVASVTPIPGGVLYRVDRRDGPSWVARPFQPGRPIERVEGDAEILRFLEENAYPAERCAHPDPVSTLDGRGVLVTNYVEGSLPGQGGRSKVPQETYEVLGELLGRAHRLPAVSGAMMREAGSWHGDPRHEGLPSEDIAAGLSWLAEVEARVAPHGRSVFESLREEISGAEDGRDLPMTFVHPDFAPVNTIESPDGFVVVDWAAAGRGPRIMSLANLLWSTAGDHPGTPTGRVDAVVAGYSAHARLEPDELSRLAGVMRIRPLLFACWTYRSSVDFGYTPSGAEPWWPDHNVTDAIASRATDAFRSAVPLEY